MVQWGVAKGLQQALEQGMKKGMKQVVVRYVELHFPAVIPLAKQQAAKAKTSSQLQAILDQLFVARTDDEAKAALLGGDSGFPAP